MTYRVIALDLDGTLLTQKKQILPESLEALAKARQQGIKVLIVTGRHHVAIRPFYKALDLNTPAICCNGTYLYDCQRQRVLASTPLKKEQAFEVIGLMQQYHINGLLYVDNAMLYQDPCEHVIRLRNWSATLAPELRPELVQVESLAAAAEHTESIWKFAIAHSNLDELRQFGDTVETRMQLACEWSWHDQVDIAQTGNSKGKRLAEWVESQGMSMQEVVAFGDNFNDLSMIESAGLGVAMGHSEKAIRDRADLVTGTNEQPSIAEVIYSHILK